MRITLARLIRCRLQGRQFYPNLKKQNPDLPILVRECSGVQPRLYARYGNGKEVSLPLANKDAPDIHKNIEAVGQAGIRATILTFIYIFVRITILRLE